MPRRILILDAHPDPDPARLIHALADACAEGAQAAGHETRRLRLADLDFPLLRSRAEFEDRAPPPAIARAQRDVEWAEHMVWLFPLWMGGPPARLKAFCEQLFRPDFAAPDTASGGLPRGRLKGRSARLVVTMGMPAPAYRLWFLSHGVKSLERGVLRLSGVAPVRRTYFGMVEQASEGTRAGWLSAARRLGANAR
ncbi:MAG: NAD(P)H-dependent oxidoreductase [Pseudomonadota bacterium]